MKLNGEIKCSGSSVKQSLGFYIGYVLLLFFVVSILLMLSWQVNLFEIKNIIIIVLVSLWLVLSFRAFVFWIFPSPLIMFFAYGFVEKYQKCPLRLFMSGLVFGFIDIISMVVISLPLYFLYMLVIPKGLITTFWPFIFSVIGWICSAFLTMLFTCSINKNCFQNKLESIIKNQD